jgi:MoxR-like ATPase
MSDHTLRLVRHTDQLDTHDHQAAREHLEARRLPRAQHSLAASARYFQLDRRLETAMNMALAVGAPLLLTGEPGTGKTQAAWYLGWYFDIPVFAYQVWSTSTADDMKYDFDAVAYLRNAQHPNEPALQRQEFLHNRAFWLASISKSNGLVEVEERCWGGALVQTSRVRLEWSERVQTLEWA